MKTTPLRIQLAIQGGGAKICALIAALEAVQRLEKEGVLQVTRIAGTSAGAIAGALFASRVEMTMVKERLGNITSDELAQMFPMPTRRQLFWKLIVKQEPLWSSKPLRDLLNRLFGDSGAPSTLQDASKQGVDMRIVASDLSNGQKIVYSGDAPLMNALLDSAGLPFCFRTWTKSGSAVVVDGGICENLPSEELEEFSKQDGPVVGISFVDKERAFVEDIVGFSKSLLNTAMTNSERRARYRLGESVFNIETDVGTFDFARALEVGLGDKYTLVRMKAEEFFRGFAISQTKKVNVVQGDLWATENRSIMERLGKVYETQFRATKCSYVHCSMLIEARSLLGKGDPDLVHNIWEFRTLKEPVYCRAVGVTHTLAETTFEGTTISAIDVSMGKSVDITHIPALLPSLPIPRPLLLFFHPFLPPDSGPYKLEFKDLVDDTLRSLREGGKDEMFVNLNSASGVVGRIDLVVHLPKTYAEVRMAPKEEFPVGHLMSKDELAQYPPPPNFRAMGWAHTNLEKPFLGVDLLPS
jgi:predicted acylesterase/phospholipase RssA